MHKKVNHCSKRTAAVRKALREKEIDAFLAMSLSSIRYLTGFSGTYGACVAGTEKTTFISDFRYREQASTEVSSSKNFFQAGPLSGVISNSGSLKNCRVVGFEGDTLPYAAVKELEEIFPAIKFVSLPAFIESFAAQKDDAEIEMICRAVKISDMVFSELLALIKPGVTEAEIGAEITYRQRMHGAEKDAFEPIVASGERGALPHGRASFKKIRKGEFVTLDFGCVVNGYGSDLTRTIAVGKADEELLKIYSIVRDAQQRAIDLVRDGIEAKQIDAAARSYIAEKGYKDFFKHGLGHGIGLVSHGFPKINPLSSAIIKKGNVMTIEPGIYLPGIGGVRIEDDIAVEKRGCTVLTASAKDLIVL